MLATKPAPKPVGNLAGTPALPLFVLLLLWGLAPPRAFSLTCSLPPALAAVDPDERVVLFDTPARLDVEADEWVIPVHGWIFEPEHSVIRRHAFAKVLEERYGIRPETEEERRNYERRVLYFLVDNERRERPRVRVGGEVLRVPRSGANGHFETEVRISRVAAEAAAEDRFLLEMAAVTDEERRLDGEAHLIGTTGLSVISDVDDTIKDSEVANRARLLRKTFLEEFEAVEGMPELYRALADRGVAFHFVSSSPWRLYEPLREFFAEAAFPPATLHLQHARLWDGSMIELFDIGTFSKEPAIEALLAAYPERDFLLVGDTGEQDPELYAAISRAHPERVRRVLLRNITGATLDDARFAPLVEDLDATRWTLFEEAAELDVESLLAET